jgi:competence ComEA-like helix-hairpin-helix protein
VTAPAAAAEEITEAISEPPVTAEVPVVVEAEPAELTDAALADESLAIFAEKPSVVEPPPAEPAPVEPTPIEPVAETAPAVATIEEPPVEAGVPVEPVADKKPTSTSEFLINLNRCAFEDLQRIDGVGPVLAKRITDYRDAHGAFQSIYELRNVPGIGRKTFRALAGVPLRRLNRLLGIEHDHELSLSEIARLISALPGVEGCVLASADGLPLTGQLPESFDQERFSVFAPQLFKKIGRCTRELTLGDVNRLTLFTETHPVSIYKAGAIYLVVVHHPERFSKALLRRCANISEELSRLCRQRAAV